jgi:hypothetical protein
MNREERLEKNKEWEKEQRLKDESVNRILMIYRSLPYRDRLLFLTVAWFLRDNPIKEER